jgi:hypothetical protein
LVEGRNRKLGAASVALVWHVLALTNWLLLEGCGRHAS